MNSKLWKIALIAALHVAVIGSIMVFESCKPKSKMTPAVTPPPGATTTGAVTPETLPPPPPPLPPVATTMPPPVVETKPLVEAKKVAPTSSYTVVKGDSLSVIAHKHGTTVTAIKNANKLSGDVIRVGQKLTIPSPQESGVKAVPTPSKTVKKPAKKTVKKTAPAGAGAEAAAAAGGYTVEKGDTPEKIARKLGVKLQALLDANPGLDPKKLQVGQKLSVPGAAAPAPTAAPGMPAAPAPEAPPAPTVPSGAPEIPGAGAPMAPPPLTPPPAEPTTPPPAPAPGTTP